MSCTVIPTCLMFQEFSMVTIDLRWGYILGLTTYMTWGLFPLYFKSLERIPAVEIIARRTVWSTPLGAALLLSWKHPNW